MAGWSTIHQRGRCSRTLTSRLLLRTVPPQSSCRGMGRGVGYSRLSSKEWAKSRRSDLGCLIGNICGTLVPHCTAVFTFYKNNTHVYFVSTQMLKLLKMPKPKPLVFIHLELTTSHIAHVTLLCSGAGLAATLIQFLPG